MGGVTTNCTNVHESPGMPPPRAAGRAKARAAHCAQARKLPLAPLPSRLRRQAFRPGRARMALLAAGRRVEGSALSKAQKRGSRKGDGRE